MRITRKIIDKDFLFHKRLLRKSITLTTNFPMLLYLLYLFCQLFYVPLQKGTFFSQQLLIGRVSFNYFLF